MGANLIDAKRALEAGLPLPVYSYTTDDEKIELSLAQRIEGYAQLSPEEKYRVRNREHDKELVGRSRYLETKTLDQMAVEIPHSNAYGAAKIYETLVKTRRLLSNESTENVAVREMKPIIANFAEVLEAVEVLPPPPPPQGKTADVK